MVDTITTMAKGGGVQSFDVGTKKIQFLNQSGTVTLTAATHKGTTVVIQAVGEQDVYLPDATTMGGAKASALGIYNIGGPINIRYNGGKLFMRLAGRSNYTLRRPIIGTIGCILDLNDVSTAAGKWYPRVANGSMMAPRIIKENIVAAATQDVTVNFTNETYKCIHTNSPGVSPRTPRVTGGVLQQISDTQAIEFVKDSTNGTRYRLIVMAADGTTTASTWQTLNAFVPTYMPQMVVLAQASGGFDYVLIAYQSGAAQWSARVIEITTGTATLNATSSAVTFPVLDSGGKTIEAQPSGTIHYAICFAGLTSTTAMMFAPINNTTDTKVYSYGALMTRSGAAGSPVLTISAPVRLDTSASSNNVSPSFAVLVGNTPNRVFVGAATPRVTAMFGGDGATAYDAVVVDVSVPATPTVSYRVPTGTLYSSNSATGGTWHYEDVSQTVIQAIQNNNNLPAAFGTQYYKFTVGAAAISGHADFGYFISRNSYYDYNVLNGEARLGLAIANKCHGWYPLNGSTPADGWRSADAGYIISANTGVNGYGGGVYTGGIAEISRSYGEFLEIASLTGDTNRDSASVSDNSSIQFRGWQNWTGLTMQPANLSNRGAPIYMQSGKYILASYCIAPTAATAVGGKTVADSILYTLEYPDAA